MVRKRKRSFKEQVKAKTENPLREQLNEISYTRKNKHDYRNKIDKLESRFQDKIHKKNRIPVDDISRVKTSRKRKQLRKLQQIFAKESSSQNGVLALKNATTDNEENSQSIENTFSFELPKENVIHHSNSQRLLDRQESEKNNYPNEVERTWIDEGTPIKSKRRSGFNFNHKIGQVKSRSQETLRKTQRFNNKPMLQDEAVTKFSKRKKYRRLAIWSLEKIKSNSETESDDNNSTEMAKVTEQNHHYPINEMKDTFIENKQGEKDSERASEKLNRRRRWRTKRNAQRLSQRNGGNRLSLATATLDELKQTALDKNTSDCIHKKTKKKREKSKRITRQLYETHGENKFELATTPQSKEIPKKSSLKVDKSTLKGQKKNPDQIKIEKSKEKNTREKKRYRRKKNKDKLGVAAVIQVGSASSAYLSQGSDDNQAVEATEKSISSGTRLIKASKNYADKRMRNPHSDNQRKANQSRSKRKKEYHYHELKGDKSLFNSSETSSKIKQFQKKKQMKQSISMNFKSNLRERLKKTLLDTIKSSKDFIVRRAKGIVVAAVAILGLGTVLLNLVSASVSGVANSTSSVLATSYLSSKNVLSTINRNFSGMENDLYEELENIESRHPGYDEYLVKKNGDIGHNVHELLSYITARYGEVKSLADIQPALQELFNEMYKVDYTVETETRCRTTKDSDGKSVQVPYIYRKLVATLQKKELDTIVHEAFANHPDNLKHYQALFSAQGNMAELFGNSNLVGGTSGSVAGGIGGGKEYEASDDVQKSIVRAASITPSPGPGWCAMWVTQVYQNAGLGFIGGNANDMYRNFTYTSDRSKLKVGMIVAVESCSTGGEAGRIYGHVGIYIGDGKVMDNIGQIRVTSLDNWIATCCQTSPVGFGFPPNVQ